MSQWCLVGDVVGPMVGDRELKPEAYCVCGTQGREVRVTVLSGYSRVIVTVTRRDAMHFVGV